MLNYLTFIWNKSNTKNEFKVGIKIFHVIYSIFILFYYYSSNFNILKLSLKN